jgi:hypothetical protein
VTRWLSLLLAVAALLAPAAARADGDPPSDFLLTQPLYVPLEVKPPPASIAQLTAILNDAKAKGYEVRVALVATKADLGAVPSLFGKPQIYARFLHQEIRFVYKGPLLIVMPSGVGYHEQTARGSTLLVSWPEPSTQPDLAQAAVPLVQLLAKQHGVEVEIPPLAGGGHSLRDRVLIAAGVVLLAALVAGALWIRRRRSPGLSPES